MVPFIATYVSGNWLISTREEYILIREKEVVLDFISFSSGFHNKGANRFYKQNLWHIKNDFLNRYTDNAKKLSLNQGEFCITKNFVSP